jgi:hypothetical protein
MPLRRTLTGKEAMASRRVEFIAARDHTTMASHCDEFIATRDRTPTWVDFEAAKAEWDVEQEEARAAQKERKRLKALKKRESRRRKKEADAQAAEESRAEFQGRWTAADKPGKENGGVWPAWPDASTCQDHGDSYRDIEESWAWRYFGAVTAPTFGCVTCGPVTCWAHMACTQRHLHFEAQSSLAEVQRAPSADKDKKEKRVMASVFGQHGRSS